MELLTAQKNTTNPVTLEKIRLELKKYDRQISMWTPRLADMRRNATLYIRASSFVNKDILGPKFLKLSLTHWIWTNFLLLYVLSVISLWLTSSLQIMIKKSINSLTGIFMILS